MQHFVEDEAFGLEQIEIRGRGRALRAAISDPLMKIGKGQQSTQCFLPRKRLEYAIPLLERKAGVGSTRRRFPVNAGWIRTHAGIVESVKLPFDGIRGLPAVNRTHYCLWFDPANPRTLF